MNNSQTILQFIAEQYARLVYQTGHMAMKHQYIYLNPVGLPLVYLDLNGPSLDQYVYVDIPLSYQDMQILVTNKIPHATVIFTELPAFTNAKPGDSKFRIPRKVVF